MNHLKGLFYDCVILVLGKGLKRSVTWVVAQEMWFLWVIPIQGKTFFSWQPQNKTLPSSLIDTALWRFSFLTSSVLSYPVQGPIVHCRKKN